MSATRSRLIDLPVEIFHMIQSHIASPRDYFRLSITCRTAWARDDDVLTSCIVRDARILRAHAAGGPGTGFRQWPPAYEPIVYWCLRTRQAMDVVVGVVERYYWAYPDAVRGSRGSRLHTAAAYAIAAGHLGALELLLDMHAVPSLRVLGDMYMTWAVELAADASIARWLVDRGVRVRPRHMFVLHDRRLVRWGTPEWHHFMYASSESGGINLDPDDDEYRDYDGGSSE
ncbi:hypothetical protein F4811DRAFT_551253 [Daldinia bambusicola]|nr:hypothetical protein F4811DRAFT_551253 [Daldinia bambusicola]